MSAEMMRMIVRMFTAQSGTFLRISIVDKSEMQYLPGPNDRRLPDLGLRTVRGTVRRVLSMRRLRSDPRRAEGPQRVHAARGGVQSQGQEQQAQEESMNFVIHDVVWQCAADHVLAVLIGM